MATSPPPGPDWRYSYRGASPTRVAIDELAGHRFAYHIAKPAPHADAARPWYQAACSCRQWRDDRWSPSRAVARRRFLGHVARASRQGTLI